MSSSANHINFHHTPQHPDTGASLSVNGLYGAASRSRTPTNTISAPSNGFQGVPPPDTEFGLEDVRTVLFRNLYAKSEARLNALFGGQGDGLIDGDGGIEEAAVATRGHGDNVEGEGHSDAAKTSKKPARTIDEDNYDDESDEENDTDTADASPLKSKSTGASAFPGLHSPTKASGILPSPALTASNVSSSSQWQGKSTEDVRKKLEEDRKAVEEAAKQSFHTLFHTIDNDRDAMLEQQKLEESDRQVDVEMSGQAQAVKSTTEGSLSRANLGASSLTLKHLIARIDAQREKVRMSDQELRNLIFEAKKNTSKWASEDRIGQEELYEAAEKVLSELKAMTEHSQPFLQRVNKRDAPDYYTIIKHPMDLSTMTKKLKAIQYKSKQDFVEDLNLIWANCLKYNADPSHFLRRHALFMRKETEKLVPLIPDIVIRDRAEVEAEERRLHNADGDLDGGEDSDDEPIISSRGRKAPKKAKKGSNARKAPAGNLEGTPGADSKPMLNHLSSNGSGAHWKHDLLRADSDAAMEGSQNGFATPPPGTLTPIGLNGVMGSAAPGSQADPMDLDTFGGSVNGATIHSMSGLEEANYEDAEYKAWKQVTKRDRALVAAERHRLFKGDRINPEEPALLRSRAGMRRWVRKQKEAEAAGVLGKRKRDSEVAEVEEPAQTGESLAEGIEGVEERILPDYYDTMAAIPDISERLQWVEDADGQVIATSEEFLRVVPRGIFLSPESGFTKKMDGNMRQMQATRKICTKIGVVKQMQLQSQMYQNQFQKYEPVPFSERDVEPHAVSDDSPIMAQWVSRAALQRSVGKIFFHAGFEEFQPSALEAVTDIASDYFVKLGKTLAEYLHVPKTPASSESEPETEAEAGETWKSKYSVEEAILHCLNEGGVDVESLENYVKDDVERLTSKLGVLHDRMKGHLADMLRPALTDAGPDGVNAFNDGSEQFVGGDFAEDLDEDFFGFKDLGLDKELGLTSLSVPLHLLQNRMHNAYQAQNTSATAIQANSLAPLPPYPQLTMTSLPHEIGLVQNFFLAKLHANGDQPLVEDEDLPLKQRFPKPRLPPTGKISSPRKKVVREPGPGKGHPRKKMKLAEGGVWVKDDTTEKPPDGKPAKGVSKLKLGSVNLSAPSNANAAVNANANANSNANANANANVNGSPSKANITVNGVHDSGGSGALSVDLDGSRDGDGDFDDDFESKADRAREKTIIAGGGGDKGAASKKKALAGLHSENSNSNGSNGGMISPESLGTS